mmetsp:Transcript_35961/g.43416  ORF Transcript_35961/g.43416 Transcript_35961/m.43416 type:complete len:153 (-) Transcript_35961:1175-1633(-)|eukprot:CAMPEP_0197847906 /NCGR_PEP_ID=MMETSP1438-20131217/7436_1 /TAXON_ID=1461541 /ORGANISM="Pterosperma sp., Strain CCMP1384" /LENGTH=152 /DNA_ID=CAMNT_0043459977 /DNA_START=262 /DNA_END=720 /DNA_ORIENTATION=+
MDFVEVIAEPLILDKYVKFVEDDSAGAVATFSGVTRNNFEGRTVLRLEYEAYIPMAEAKLKEVCAKIREKWHNVTKIALAHRIGVVSVGETSVIIAVSSPHRRAALEATNFAINDLKATVPIWKKEMYEDGEIWKENEEAQGWPRPMEKISA